MGAWIEIYMPRGGRRGYEESLPTWERGLKCLCSIMQLTNTVVAPHVGAWIEIIPAAHQTASIRVAPHVGAWIEIAKDRCVYCMAPVAPHVGAWIEISERLSCTTLWQVAPHVGAWIEIPVREHTAHHPGRRSPRGSVD